MTARPPRGVVFDLGGVIFESPLARIADFERRVGLEPQTVAGVISENGPDGSWEHFERGELSRDEFLDEFAGEFRAAGVEVDTRALLDAIESAIIARPSMLEAVDRIRSEGWAVAALTNNWSPMGHLPLAGHFDVFVESVVEGVRKPDPEIYRRTLDRLDLEPEETAMLDDLGENLKIARAMGMATFKVVDEASALRWIEHTFGWDR